MIGVLCTGGFSIRVKAADADTREAVEMSTVDASKETSTLRKDNIITKYRIHNGRVQYRRWNLSYGIWVDPYWIDLE